MTNFITTPKLSTHSEKRPDRSMQEAQENQESRRKRSHSSGSVEYTPNKKRIAMEVLASPKSASSGQEILSSDDLERVEIIKRLPGIVPESVHVEGNLILATKTNGLPQTHVTATHLKELEERLKSADLNDKKMPSRISAKALGELLDAYESLDDDSIIW